MKKSILFDLLPLAILLAFAACVQSDQNVKGNSFLDAAAMDKSVRPGDDFYAYVNGTWIKKTQIPANDIGVGGFFDLYNRTQDSLHALLDSVSKENYAKGTIDQKVGDFYASGMDSLTIEKRGLEPVKLYLQRVNDI
ncbi:MAG TPA: hypothetical protein VKR32_04955, partial [Puia sp.]|nr:hypothetical protein [Puia sp.]